MIDTTCEGKAMHACGLAQTDGAVHARVRAEYREMPGMRLTLAQAARLFNLELGACERVLESLVLEGALWMNGRDFIGSNVGRRWA